MRFSRLLASLRPRFSLRSLFAIMTLVAAICAGADELGIVGALLAFSSAVCFWVGLAAIGRGFSGEDSSSGVAVIAFVIGMFAMVQAVNFAALLAAMMLYL